jgi:hypothetical protein
MSANPSQHPGPTCTRLPRSLGRMLGDREDMNGETGRLWEVRWRAKTDPRAT